ncbi:MAG: outer membrane beta-barrel protein [Rikenellaceae bacterium]
MKITLLALLLGLCLPISAQIYAEDYILEKNNVPAGQRLQMIYGVMAGVNVPVMSDKQDIVDISNTAGYQIGMMWGLDFGGLEVVPEIWYQHSKANISHSNRDEGGELVSRSVEVPIIMAMSLGDIIRFNVGPSFSVMNENDYQKDGDDDVEEFGRMKSGAGYVAGISATISERFIVDFRYSGRFVSLDSEWYRGTSEHSYRYYNFSFNVGYRF